jgi:hypothetical protein
METRLRMMEETICSSARVGMYLLQDQGLKSVQPLLCGVNGCPQIAAVVETCKWNKLLWILLKGVVPNHEVGDTGRISQLLDLSFYILN